MTLTPPSGEQAAPPAMLVALACGWLLMALAGLIAAALGAPADLCASQQDANLSARLEPRVATAHWPPDAGPQPGART
jgi:hypothetical protein